MFDKRKKVYLFATIAMMIIAMGQIFTTSETASENLVTVIEKNARLLIINSQFSNGNKVGPLTVETTCCNEHDESFPESLLINNELMLSGESISIAGVCHTRQSELAVLVDHWGGEGTLGSSLVAYRYDSRQGNIEEVMVDYYGGLRVVDGNETEELTFGTHKLIDCRGENRLIELSSSFSPCLCDLDLVQEIDEFQEKIANTIEAPEQLVFTSFGDEFFQGEPYQAESVRISQKALESVLDDIRKFTGLPYEVKRITNGQTEAISIVYDKPIYSSFSSLLVRKEPSSDWLLIYGASPSSKGFHPQKQISVNENGSLTAAMCLDGCDWWGNQFGRVKINFDMNTGGVSYSHLADIEYEEYDESLAP